MSIATHERRITRLEHRVDTLEENLTATREDGHDTRRRVIRLELGMSQLLRHFGFPEATDEDVDEILDQV